MARRLDSVNLCSKKSASSDTRRVGKTYPSKASEGADGREFTDIVGRTLGSVRSGLMERC